MKKPGIKLVDGCRVVKKVGEVSGRWSDIQKLVKMIKQITLF